MDHFGKIFKRRQVRPRSFLAPWRQVAKQTSILVGDGGKAGTRNPQPCVNGFEFKILQQLAVSAALCRLRLALP